MLQASALDCGPAALASLLGGFGLDVPFERLREACRTGRDGTSIDALEEVALEEGLEAEQVLVPVEYPTLAAAACLPCVLVVARPGGAAHFVAVWRRHGGRVQVMDPAAGRRWPTVVTVERETFRHRALVPAAAWRAWAASDGALRVLAARLAAMGIDGVEGRVLIESAAGAGGWRRLAAMDAAVRFTRQLVAAVAVRRGAGAGRLLRAVLDDALAPPAAGVGGAVVPADCWTVRQAPADAGGGERVVCEGAVLVRVRGRLAGAGGAGPPAGKGGSPRAGARGAAPVGRADEERGKRSKGLRGSEAPPFGRADREPGERSSELRASEAAPIGPAERLPGVRAAVRTGATLVLAGAGAAVGRFAEAALLVAALEILPAAASRTMRAGVLAALLALGTAVLLCEVTAASAAQSLGRRRETGLRLRLAAKLPRLPDRYLRTRLLGDLAERAHRIGELRRGPELAAAALGAGLDVVLAAAGIAWLDPGLAAGGAAAGAGALLVPLALLPRCEERSRRASAHGAALGALYLDVLRGLAAVRAHGAATALRRRHEELLAGWLRARREAEAAGAWLETGAQGLLSLAAAGLVLGHVRRHGFDPQTMVLALWAFQRAGAGQRLALLAGRSLPLDRSLRRRIEEPLAAEEEIACGEALAEGGSGTRETVRPASGIVRLASGGMAIGWERCSVESDGRPLLRAVDLAIPGGQHVAVLGASGAGKSTLLGTVLGWHRPMAGCLRADGRELDAAVLREVRRAVAWAAPEVALWRGSLLANLGAGVRDGADLGQRGVTACDAAGIAPAEALRAARLLELVGRLEHGLQEPLGENGGRLSGGEAQRLRFARALSRPGVRLALLDEPFRGLAADLRRELLGEARTRWRCATLLCVTHSPEEAAGFDRVIVLEHGRLVEDGPPGALAARLGSRYRAMLEAEVRVAAALAGGGWRHLHLEGGRLREWAPAGEPPMGTERRPRARPGEGGEGGVGGKEDGGLAETATGERERSG